MNAEHFSWDLEDFPVQFNMFKKKHEYYKKRIHSYNFIFGYKGNSYNEQHSFNKTQESHFNLFEIQMNVSSAERSNKSQSIHLLPISLTCTVELDGIPGVTLRDEASGM